MRNYILNYVYTMRNYIHIMRNYVLNYVYNYTLYTITFSPSITSIKS